MGKKKLEQEIAGRGGHLQDISQRKELEYFPWIDKEKSDGGQGNHSYYYLIAKPFSETEKIESKVGSLHIPVDSLENERNFPFHERQEMLMVCLCTSVFFR